MTMSTPVNQVRLPGMLTNGIYVLHHLIYYVIVLLDTTIMKIYGFALTIFVILKARVSNPILCQGKMLERWTGPAFGRNWLLPATCLTTPVAARVIFVVGCSQPRQISSLITRRTIQRVMAPGFASFSPAVEHSNRILF